jgi:hypothetical protein
VEETLKWAETFANYILLDIEPSNPLLPPKVKRCWLRLQKVIVYQFRQDEGSMLPARVAAAQADLRDLAVALQEVRLSNRWQQTNFPLGILLSYTSGSIGKGDERDISPPLKGFDHRHRLFL